MRTEAIQDFTLAVRELLNDTGDTKHWTDAKIARSVAEAFRELYKVRPESRYVNNVLAEVEFPTDDDELAVFSVTYDVRWRTGIAYYAAARCFESDITDSVNLQLAAAMKQNAAANFAS